MTHPELIALLAGLRESPTDDTPRLVLADWLDEHGESDRAAFIRAQCGCFPGGYQPPTEVPRLAEWVGEPLSFYKFTFGRGLIHVHTYGSMLDAQFMRPELQAAWRTGWVDGVSLSNPLSGRLDLILSRDWFAPITTLDVSGIAYRFSDDDLQAFTDSPMLSNLHTLRLGTCNISEAGLQSLRESPNLPRLKVIDAEGPFLQAAEHVRRHVRVTSGRITFREVLLDYAGLSALATLPEMATCHTLDLSNTDLRADALDGVLARWPLPQVHDLDLSRNRWLASLHPLTARPALPYLRYLDLSENRLTTPDLLALVRSPHRQRLRWLDLRGVSLHGERAGILADPRHLPGLDRLIVDEASVSRNGLRRLQHRLGAGLVLRAVSA